MGLKHKRIPDDATSRAKKGNSCRVSSMYSTNSCRSTYVINDQCIL